MKKLILILSVTFLSNLLLGQEAFLIKNFKGDAVKEVESTTSGGDISIQSVAGDQQRVEVFIWPSNRSKDKMVSKEEIQKRLDELYDLRVEVAGNKLTAIAKPKHQNMNWKNGLSISFKIFVMKDVDAELTTSGGNIDVRAMAGEQKITTSGGNLTVDNVKGKLKGVTSGGNIAVKDSDNDIDLTTSGGNIDANNCTGKIRLSTSGGNVILMNLGGDITATTSGGDVKANDIKGDLDTHTSGGNVNLVDLACNLSAGTSGGDVKVSIKEPGKFIKLSNSGGNIVLELPAGKGYDFDLSGDKIKTNGLVNFSGKVEEDRLEGTLNGGGTKVTAHAGGSKITLMFK
jgi:DUF4097 and DUF4098 domain-containing protein YvlB